MKVIKSIPFEELKDMVFEDMKLRIDQTDIDALASPSIYNKYHKEYRIVKDELLVHQLALKKKWKEKWLYYSGKNHPDVYKEKPLPLKIMKTEVKMFIEGDDEISELLLTVGMYENKLEFLKGTLEEISRRTYHIRNAVETIKFKHGVN
jgi:hypothetical protein